MSASGPIIVLNLEDGTRAVLTPEQKARFDDLITRQVRQEIDIFFNPRACFQAKSEAELRKLTMLYDAYREYLENADAKLDTFDTTDSDLSISPPTQSFLPSQSSFSSTVPAPIETPPHTSNNAPKIKRTRSFSLKKGFSIFKRG